MAHPRVVLHVGAMKTGTSAVQAALGAHADALADAGVLYPCEPSWQVQVRAVRDALDMRVAGVQPGRWAAMAERLRTYDGEVAVLSMEFLSFADLAHARAVVESLTPAPVEAVLTLRDPARVLPSAWQEWTQNRGTASWAEYLATAARLAPGGDAHRQHLDTPAARAYGRVLDSDRVLSVWSRVMPPDRLHVLTVPPPGARPGLLWARFAGVLGLDAERYPPPDERANESLDYHAADLMWRVNRRLEGHLDFSAYESLVKNHLCKQVLAAREAQTAVPLPESAHDLAVRWARHTVDLVGRSGAHVVGDLTELEPVTGRFTEAPVPPTDTEGVVRAARDALAGLDAVERDRGTASTDLSPRGGPRAPSDGDKSSGDVDAAVAAVADRVLSLTAGAATETPRRRRGVRGLLRFVRGRRARA